MSNLIQSPQMLGVWISLACLACYFAFPSLYYAGALKVMLVAGMFFGSLMFSTLNALLGVAWMGGLMLVFHYGQNSRWYMKPVFALTAKEWKLHLAPNAAAGEEPDPEAILRHVAESWNPKWGQEQLAALTVGCANLDELLERVLEKQWRLPKTSAKDAPADEKAE